MKKYRLIVDTDTCENINDLSTFYNRTDLDTIIEVDSFTTARDLLIEYRLDTKRPTFLIYDKGENRQVLLENFRFYYNDDILYSYYNPLDVKILDFEKYGYFLNSIIYSSVSVDYVVTVAGEEVDTGTILYDPANYGAVGQTNSFEITGNVVITLTAHVDETE